MAEDAREPAKKGYLIPGGVEDGQWAATALGYERKWYVGIKDGEDLKDGFVVDSETSAKNALWAIEKYALATTAPEPGAAEQREAWDILKSQGERFTLIMGRWAGAVRPPSIADSEPSWAEGFDKLQAETIELLRVCTEELIEFKRRVPSASKRYHDAALAALRAQEASDE